MFKKYNVKIISSLLNLYNLFIVYIFIILIISNLICFVVLFIIMYYCLVCRHEFNITIFKFKKRLQMVVASGNEI